MMYGELGTGCGFVSVIDALMAGVFVGGMLCPLQHKQKNIIETANFIAQSSSGKTQYSR
jgi:hypothetical protein